MSQMIEILRALNAGETVTPMSAIMDFGCYRPGARVWELRHDYGIPVVSEITGVRKGNGGMAEVAEYSLLAADRNSPAILALLRGEGRSVATRPADKPRIPDEAIPKTEIPRTKKIEEEQLCLLPTHPYA